MKKRWIFVMLALVVLIAGALMIPRTTNVNVFGFGSENLEGKKDFAWSGTTGDGLVIIYPMNDSSGPVVDYSGNSNNGTVSGALLPAATTPISDYASADFDGTDDYINSTSFVGVSGGSDRAAAAWINASSVADKYIIVTGASGGGSGGVFRVNTQLELTSFGPTASGNTTINTGEWTCVGYSYSGGSVDFFVNGTPAGSGSITLSTVDSALQIGSAVAAGNFGNFDGNIGGVAFWNTTKNHTEMTDFCNNSYFTTGPGPTPNLTINITSPENVTYPVTTVDLNITNNTEVDTAFYSINGTANVSFTPNTTLTDLAEGLNNVSVWANDTNGTNATDIVYFTIDSLGPPNNIISPENGTTYESTIILVNITSDGTEENITYRFNGTNHTFGGTGVGGESWVQTKFNASGAGYSPNTAPENITNATEKIFTGYDVTGSIVVDGAYAYFASGLTTSDGFIYQVLLANFTDIIATYETGAWCFGSPVVANGYVYVGCQDGVVHQLDADNVSISIANYTTGAQISKPGNANSDYFYIASHDEQLYQFNASNVSQKIANFTLGGIGLSTPALWEDYLYYGDGGNMRQLNASNVSQQINVQAVTGSIYKTLAVAEGYVYTGSNQQYVYQFNATNVSNSPINLTITSGQTHVPPSVNGEFAFIPSGGSNNSVIRANSSNISQIFEVYAAGGEVNEAVAISNDSIFFATKGPEYDVIHLNKTNFSDLKSFFNGTDEFASAPSFANGVLYIGDLNGTAYQIGGSPTLNETINTQGPGDFFFESWVFDSLGAFTYNTSNFSVSGAAPVINLTAPENRTIITDGETLYLNWTIISGNAVDCDYTYNGANTSVTCADLNTTFTYVGGVDTLLFYAENAFGNGTLEQITWDSDLRVINETFNTTALETSDQDFLLWLNYNSSDWLSAAAFLNYDGTTYSGTGSGAGDDVLFNTSVSVPAINDSEENKTFNWTLTLTNVTGPFNFTTADHNQTIVKVNFSLCNYSDSPQLFFETYSTTEPTLAVNATFQATFNISAASGAASTLVRSYQDLSETNSSWGFCIEPNTTAYTVSVDISVDATNYTPTSHFIVDTDVSSPGENISLYLLNDSEATLTEIVVTDQDFQPVEEVYTTIQRYDLGTDTYYNVGMTRSDSSGSDLAYLKWFDDWYRFILVYQGEVVLQDGPKKISATPQTFRIGTIAPSDYEKFRDIEYSLIFNETTDNFVLTFVETTGGVSESCLRTIKRNVTDDYVICDICETSSSATLYCNIAAEGNGTFIADFYARGSPAYWIDQLAQFQGAQNELFELIGNDDGTGMAIVFAGIVLSFFLITPALGVLGAILGMIGAISLGFQPLDYTAFIGITVVGIAIMWAVQR